jgi:multiple sugar transport system permease protein
MDNQVIPVIKKRRKHLTPLEIFERGFFGIIKYSALVAASIIALLPLVICFFNAFKPEDEYMSTSRITPPENFLNFENFKTVWRLGGMTEAFTNSAIILVGVLFGSILMSSMLAFVLNRFKFKGNILVRNLFIFAALIPGVAMQVTVYKLMISLSLTGSITGYMLLLLGTDVIAIYIFLQYFENLSVSLDESAILDGCTYFGVFFKILLPLTKPAIVTSMILKGVVVYNEYYMANLYLQQIKVVSTTLYRFASQRKSAYELISTGVIITMIPALIIFLIFQKQIYSGLGSHGVKG